ncbi:TetR/AcrR family transcriptional regulator [Lacticaseibacillus jixiensis]|uniref:TetR/AcrR family transcriptional regulator n=1 Tax=Lacticaseibacillus jixiensis TaxID=3231926 RepID=UPI0036F351F3
MAEDTDLRIQKTRRAIQEAFFEEIAEKPFAALCVARLAQRAEIGKATFYNHYTDKYDLARKMIEANLLPLDQLLMQRAQGGHLAHLAEPFPPEYQPIIQHLRLLTKIHTPEVDFEQLAKQQFARSFKRQLDQRSVMLSHADDVSAHLASLAYSFLMGTINNDLDPRVTYQQLNEFFLALRALQTVPVQ